MRCLGPGQILTRQTIRGSIDLGSLVPGREGLRGRRVPWEEGAVPADRTHGGVRERMTRGVLAVVGLLFLALGTEALVAPIRFAARTGMVLPSAAALAEVRAAYSGFFVVMTALVLGGAWWPTRTRPAVGWLALLFTVFALARMLSLVMDGWPGEAGFRFLLVEATGALVAVACWRGLAPSPAERS